MSEISGAGRGSTDEYCAAHGGHEGHHMVSHSVIAPPVRWVERCSMCGHISSKALQRQMLTFDENTLMKVGSALRTVGLGERGVIDAVNAMQNLGILFREPSAASAAEDPVLDKVRRALYSCLTTETEVEDVIIAIENAGIRFRERPPRGGIQDG